MLRRFVLTIILVVAGSAIYLHTTLLLPGPPPSGRRFILKKDHSEQSSYVGFNQSGPTREPTGVITTNSSPEEPDIERLPPSGAALPKRVRTSTDSPKSTRVVRVSDGGMQKRYLVQNLGFYQNRFFNLRSGRDLDSALPQRVFIPDGRAEPLVQNHKYYGHEVETLDAVKFPCQFYVRRPTIFVYRMSGHSTYHLWENNLGPFFQTLIDFDADVARLVGASDATAHTSGYRSPLWNISQLLVVFTDNKPRHGPKNPWLLDRLMRSFTDRPILNASRIGEGASLRDGLVCFETAIVGQSASSYRMRPLVDLMLHRFLSRPAARRLAPQWDDASEGNRLPEVPRVLYISRSHPSVIRGRKVRNEADAVAALNSTILAEYGPLVGMERAAAALRVVFMEDYRTYEEQIVVAHSAQIMVSPHGGGVANCIWMRPGSVMLEFTSPAGKTLPSMYHSMCKRAGVQHRGVVASEDPSDAVENNPQWRSNPRLFSNLIIPVSLMETEARAALATYKRSYASHRPH